MPPLYAVTLQAPWAWCVAERGKTLENRSWRPRLVEVGGTIAIHASAKWTRQNADAAAAAAGCTVDEMVAHARNVAGRIVAVATFDGIVADRAELTAGDERWWAGPLAWRLRDVRGVSPSARRQVAGGLGLWPVQPEAEVDRLLAAAGAPDADACACRHGGCRCRCRACFAWRADCVCGDLRGAGVDVGAHP